MVAVNSVVTMPTVMVTAKPRTGPEPKTNSITCARNAVALLSMIVPKARRNPVSSAFSGVRPLRDLLADALVDQDVGVHRHAERQQDAGHAGQRQRRLQQRQDRELQHQVDQQRDVREPAEQAVEDAPCRRSRAGTRRPARWRRRGCCRPPAPARRCAPRPPSAAPAARRRAAAPRGRCADCAVKLPLIWPRPPVIGSRITGAVITLSSSTMAKGWPTLARLMSAKRRAPTLSKVKFTTHSPVCGVLPGRASVRFGAVHLDPAAHRDPCRAGWPSDRQEIDARAAARRRRGWRSRPADGTSSARSCRAVP